MIDLQSRRVRSKQSCSERILAVQVGVGLCNLKTNDHIIRELNSWQNHMDLYREPARFGGQNTRQRAFNMSPLSVGS